MDFFLSCPILTELTRATAWSDRPHIVYSPLSVPSGYSGGRHTDVLVWRTRALLDILLPKLARPSLSSSKPNRLDGHRGIFPGMSPVLGDWCPPWHRLHMSWVVPALSSRLLNPITHSLTTHVLLFLTLNISLSLLLLPHQNPHIVLAKSTAHARPSVLSSVRPSLSRKLIHSAWTGVNIIAGSWDPSK